MEKNKIIEELKKISLLANEYKEKYENSKPDELVKEGIAMDFEGFKVAIETLIENMTDKSPEHEL